jgi:hypothetical protein
MDGVHMLGEWYGCPAGTPEFTPADALRALEVAPKPARTVSHPIRRGGMDE